MGGRLCVLLCFGRQRKRLARPGPHARSLVTGQSMGRARSAQQVFGGGRPRAAKHQTEAPALQPVNTVK